MRFAYRRVKNDFRKLILLLSQDNIITQQMQNISDKNTKQVNNCTALSICCVRQKIYSFDLVSIEIHELHYNTDTPISRRSFQTKAFITVQYISPGSQNMPQELRYLQHQGVQDQNIPFENLGGWSHFSIILRIWFNYLTKYIPAPPVWTLSEIQLSR